MGSERFPPLAEWPHQLRERAAAFRADFRQWRTDLRSDPAKIWYSPVTRLFCGLILMVAALIGITVSLKALVQSLSGANDAANRQTATIFVACTNRDCAASFSVELPRSFKEWPITCEKCNNATCYRGKLCKQCRGWYALTPDGPAECSRCAAAAAVRLRDASKATSKPADVDDAEDGWGG